MNEKEIEEYAQRRADQHAEREGDNGNAEISFRAGFSAGRELGRLEGEISGFRIAPAKKTNRAKFGILLEAQLKALLGSGKVE